MGLVNYHSSYVQNLSLLLSPIKNLLKKHVQFEWSEDCEDAFSKIKNKITNYATKQLYIPSKVAVLSCDASYDGVGGCLQQHDELGNLQIVCYVSTSLLELQKKFSVIELEMFAVVFTLLRFKHFVHGTKFIINTDHKPTMDLFKKPDVINSED